MTSSESGEVERLLRYDQVCDRFEAAVRSGARPEISGFLDEVPEHERADLLRELRLLEADYLESSPSTLPQLAGESPASYAETSLVFDDDTALQLSTPDLGSLGEFQLRRELGRGGMGVVYEAYQQSIGRVVALKVIHPALLASLDESQQQRAAERFANEARAAGQLQHDNIVTVFESGVTEGLHYYVMQYVAGPSLAMHMREQSLEPRRSAEMVMQVAAGVHEAHRHGILHRDLKPSNLLLEPSTSRLLVCDFGLAKLLQNEQSGTMTGEVFGSPPYMSPEQVADSASVTVASDVYGLGATLYHMLTGQPPFSAATAIETMHQVVHGDLVPVRRLSTGVDRDLETICHACLAREPSRRYASAAALSEDLAHYLAGRSLSVRRAGWAERCWRWARHRPAVATLLTLLAAVVFTGGLGVAQQWQRAELNEQLFRSELVNQYVARGLAAADDGDVSGGLLWSVKAFELDAGRSDRPRGGAPAEDRWAAQPVCHTRARLVASGHRHQLDRPVRRWDTSGDVWRYGGG